MSYSPTPRDLDTLRAYLNAGSVVGAAQALKVNTQTVKNRLYQLRRLMGCATNTQLVFTLHAQMEAKPPRAKRKAA